MRLLLNQLFLRQSRKWAVALALLGIHGAINAVHGDVGPPVKIRLVKELVQPAVPGEEYPGTFEVLVGAEGTIDSIMVEGVGWRDLEVNAVDSINVRAGDVLRFDFTGTPGGAQQRIRVRLVFDGRWSHDLFNPAIETNEYGELNSVVEIKQ